MYMRSLLLMANYVAMCNQYVASYRNIIHLNCQLLNNRHVAIAAFNLASWQLILHIYLFKNISFFIAYNYLK